VYENCNINKFKWLFFVKKLTEKSLLAKENEENYKNKNQPSEYYAKFWILHILLGNEDETPEQDHYLIRVKKGERLYKFFYFRPMAGRHYHFEYRILTKEKNNGMLEMVSYNFRIENAVPQKSSITRVPKISKEQLEEIVQNVRMKTNTGPDEFEELNLSGFSTIDEQIEFLKRRDRVDTMYIM